MQKYQDAQSVSWRLVCRIIFSDPRPTAPLIFLNAARSHILSIRSESQAGGRAIFISEQRVSQSLSLACNNISVGSLTLAGLINRREAYASTSGLGSPAAINHSLLRMEELFQHFFPGKYWPPLFLCPLLH